MDHQKVDMRICKRRRTSSDGTDVPTINYLLSAVNEDILREVLSWLPIRDLYRAKCVCKKWHSLVSSPNFLEMHSRRKHKPSRGLLITTNDSLAREFVFYYSALYKLQPHRDGGEDGHYRRVFLPRMRFSYSDYQWMTQVVDGLVCLYSTNRLTLVNICTRETLDLPPAPAPRKDYHTAKFQAHLGGSFSRKCLNATNCTATRYHLGYDPVCKVYKVLSLSYMCTENCSGPGDLCWCPTFITPQILMLIGPDVSSYKWREVQRAPHFRCQTQSFCGNGYLYWMHQRENKTLPDGSPTYVPCHFNMVREFFTIPLSYEGLPPNCRSLPFKVLLFRGRLTYADCFSSGESLSFYRYTCEGGQCWWEKDTLDLPEVLIENSRCDGVTPVGNLPNGDVLLANDRANDIFTPVCSYDHETKCFELFKVGKFPPSVASMSRVDAAVHITCLEENLTPLHHLLDTMEGSSSE